MNLLEQFANHIEFCGIGTVADDEHDGNIFWGWMPDQPDLCVCVFSSDSSYGGSDSGARLQVIVRGNTVQEAYELSQRIVDELTGFDGYLAGDGAKAAIEVINASSGIGSDNKKREMFSSNFRVHYCNF